jgi:hypothetical protein
MGVDKVCNVMEQCAVVPPPPPPKNTHQVAFQVLPTLTRSRLMSCISPEFKQDANTVKFKPLYPLQTKLSPIKGG